VATERLLLVSFDRLGDLLFTLPALAHLREAFAEAELQFATTRYAAGVLEEHPHVDRLFAVERSGNSIARWLHWQGFLRRLRERPPDRLVLFRVGHDGRALLRRLPGIPADTVRDLPEELRRSAHTSALRTALAYRVSGRRDVPAAPPRPTLEVPPRFAAAARERLARLGVDPSRCVALHPGVNRLVRRRGWRGRGAHAPSPKLWPTERWIALGRALVERGRVPLFTGSGGEVPICAELVEAVGGPACSAAGELHVLEVGGLYAAVRGLVASDTGPGHLAAAVGAPLVSLFGPTDPALYAPLAPETQRRILRRNQACDACRGSASAGHTCMEAIEVSHVLEAADPLGL
jgi:ADP-heptose:LPS heptosyltransferase